MSNVTLLTGAIWGLAGAVAMVVVMNARGGEAPPPFAVFWAKFIGDGNPKNAMPKALLLHAIYAFVAGAVYTVVFNAFDLGFAITSITGGVIWGIIYGIALLIGAMVFWGTSSWTWTPTAPKCRPLPSPISPSGLCSGSSAPSFPIWPDGSPSRKRFIRDNWYR